LELRAVNGLTPGNKGDGTVQNDDSVNFIYGFARDYPKALPLGGQLAELDRIEPKGVPAVNNNQAVPELGVRYDAREAEVLFGIKLRANLLDWIAAFYELDLLGPVKRRCTG
jgi:hypothetical protein